MIDVNQERLWHTMMHMAEVGKLPGGGVCRTALSDEDRRGRELFVRWCQEAGCAVDVDQVGNIFARRAGRSRKLGAVATGSHLDTQPHGGRFDGVFGVLAGLEIVRSLNDANIETAAPIDIVNWTNEEGVRFSPPLTGSAAFAGQVTAEDVHAIRTHDAVTVGEELSRTGYLGPLEAGKRDISYFVEAHIEQGPRLEAEGLAIGVVTGVQGIRWLTVDVNGRDGHAGTVPMDLRRDAMAGAARMISECYDIAVAAAPDIRATVGRVDVVPNSGSTIPGKVVFNIDLRHPIDGVLETVEQRLRKRFSEISLDRSLETHFSPSLNNPAVTFDEDLVAAVRKSAVQRGFPHCDMISGAGHDAMNVAAVVPTAMIFVPCREGISHNEAEFASPEDLAAGANVLLDTILSKAGAMRMAPRTAEADEP